jgi:hypothetical protein
MVDLAPDERYEQPDIAGRSTSADPDGARWFRGLSVLVSAIGAAVLIGASIRLGGGIANLSPFVAWGLFPFGLGVFGLRAKGVGVPRSVGVILASGFGLAVYGNLLLSSRLSSTAGLAFLFIPIWQTVACGAALLLTLKWRGKSDAA